MDLRIVYVIYYSIGCSITDSGVCNFSYFAILDR